MTQFFSSYNACRRVWMRVVCTQRPAFHWIVSVNDTIIASTSLFISFSVLLYLIYLIDDERILLTGFAVLCFRLILNWWHKFVLSRHSNTLKQLRFETWRFYKHSIKWSLMTGCRTHHGDNHFGILRRQQPVRAHVIRFTMSKVLKTHISLMLCVCLFTCRRMRSMPFCVNYLPYIARAWD